MFTGPAQVDDGADINGMAAAKDGFFFAAGYQHEAAGKVSWVVRKLTPDGREAWLDVYAGATQFTDTRADRIITEPDGSIITAGHELAAPWPDYDWVIRKSGADGREEWVVRFTGVGGREDLPRALARTPDGLLVAGYETEALGERTWMALGLDRNGRAKWKMSGVYSAYRTAYANGVAAVPGGGSFFLAGGPADGWLLRRYAATGGTEVPQMKFPDALFDTKSDVLTGGAQKALAATAEGLKADPDLLVRVEGHADERGTDALNYRLGLDRAGKAAEFLAAAGIPRGRMIIQSLGRTAPAVNDSGPEAWRRNRRVHVVTLPMVRDREKK
jgi:outer membrane protein OmpA-like peptidoglycan-associated protein